MRLKFAVAVVCALAVILPGEVGTASGPPASEGDRINNSRAQAPVVVVGVAGDATSRWEDGNIFTYTTVAVSEVERGEAPSSIRVRTLGGTVEEITQTVSHGVTFRHGERSRLYLRRAGDHYRLVSGNNAKDSLDPAPPGGGFSAAAATACDPGDPGLIPGSGYCRYGDLSKWFDVDQPAYYRVNGANLDGILSSTAVTAIRNALATWEADTASFMDFEYLGTTTSRVMAMDGTSMVYFRSATGTNNCDDGVACAVAWTVYSGGLARILEFDIEFNDPTYAFAVGAVSNRYDVQSVATHEAGHALGLHHPVDCAQVMGVQVVDGKVFGCIPKNSTSKRTLGSGDLNGVRAIYPNPWMPNITSYEYQGGALAAGAGPDVASWAPGRLDVFGRGVGNDLLHKWYTGSWNGWESLPPPSSGCPLSCTSGLTSDPGAVSTAANSIDVFGRGPNNNLYQTKWNGSAWTSWTSLGAPTGGLASGPDAATDGTGRVYVFARAVSGGAVWFRSTTGLTWSAWTSIGAPAVGATNDPSVASWGPGHVQVFVRGGDGALWHRFSTNSGATWSVWYSLGGGVQSSPDAMSQESNRIEVWVRGTDNSVHRNNWNGVKWSGWKTHGGVATSGPGVVGWSFNRVDMFVTGTNGVYHQWCCR